MASPSGHSRPIPISEPSTADDSADSGSTGSGSYSSGDSLQFSLALCRWRTLELHDQECSRYFDCPSHILERRSSMDDVQEPRTPGGGPSATSEALDANSDASGGSIDGADAHSTERTPNDQSHQDTELRVSIGSSPALSTSTEAGIATGAQHNEPIILSIRTSSAVGRSNSATSQSGTSRSQSHGTSTPLPDMQRAGETYRAAYERFGLSGSLSSPAYPAIESSGEPTSHWNHRRSAVQGDQASEVGTTRQTQAQSDDGSSLEFVLPRWQPDAEVTYCPICHTQFSIFVRKHHCRKCGRVVCNSCSPHRIIIPHQYIVRPPGSDISMPPSLLLDGLGAGYFDVNGPSGGERVRLCNPCVPDPNTAPPQSPTSSAGASPRSSHQRSRNSIGSVYGVASPANRYGAVLTTSRSGNAYQYYSPRSRSITMGPQAHGGEAGSSSHHRVSTTYQSSFDRSLAVGLSSASSASRRHRHSSFGDHASSSRQRALPPPPQIAEEDECPICHRELPSRELPDFEDHRESHIATCIRAHSTYGSPRTGTGDTAPPPAPRRTGMYTYAATEKDCIDDAECTICLEEFTVGVPMARLECLCRFHRSCISAWFVNHPGRCPVHQHDGFGF
ncbi:E3 ubiquitin-protein ligase PIB1 [Tolypocladium ophioglossoides CBS 100239]|uniref:RING-type E3 ubiquitin transferase n=1 Tax=Tolypocladium ophioglossoides (strain CBS 100239) TaxID=1163406 RepID=A0A0L0NLH6_TOLOC|nr:E3 ubiquitin-protein ligase PIB1 [Tolypocladium ophioglossoides CBS 100239]